MPLGVRDELEDPPGAAGGSVELDLRGGWARLISPSSSKAGMLKLRCREHTTLLTPFQVRVTKGSHKGGLY